MHLKKHRWFWHSLALTFCIIFAAVAAWVAVNRFWQYEVFYYDFGIYDQAIRRLAAFQPPVIEHYTVGGKIIWADHLHPGIMLLAPIYWFTDRSEALLIVQAVVVAASGYVLFLTSRSILKSGGQALAILASYFLFAGVQNALITDFHEVTIMALFLSLVYWAVINNRWWLTIIFFILMMSFKETFFLTGVGLSIFIFFYRKKWRKLAVGLGLGSLLYGFLAIKYIIPYFSGGAYVYIEKYELEKIPSLLVWPIIKLKTVLLTFWSFLFLPLLYLPTLPLIILNFIPRFLSAAPSRWDLGMHYNAEIAPTLAISAALGLVFINTKFSRKIGKIVAIALVLNSLFLYRFVLHGPLALAYNPAFAAHSANFAFLNNLVAQIPTDVSVMTMNNLAVRFTDRQVYLMRENFRDYKPDYIVLDMRPEQNPNDFYASNDPQRFFEDVQSDYNYTIVYHQGEQYVFKRVQK